jgi:hypothetical protein
MVDVSAVTEARLADAGRKFARLGFVKLPFLVPEETKRQVARETERLIAEHGVRRDFAMAATEGTPRRMRNVRQAEISQHGSVLPAVYHRPELRAALTVVTGEEVLPCAYEPERFVITELRESGDIHGWHWDDFSFALVWVIDCPTLEHGGFIQCVPNTVWDKHHPQLHRQFVANPIYSFELMPGDLYLMRTDTTLHRVFPITAGRRLIVNMAYAAWRDLYKHVNHDTMDTLWSARSAPEGTVPWDS